GAYVENRHQVTRTILRTAAAEVFARSAVSTGARRGWPYLAAGLMAGAVISGAAAWHLIPRAIPAAPKVSSAAAPKPSAAALARPAPVSKPAPALPLVAASEEAALGELAGLWGATLPSGAP